MDTKQLYNLFLAAKKVKIFEFSKIDDKDYYVEILDRLPSKNLYLDGDLNLYIKGKKYDYTICYDEKIINVWHEKGNGSKILRIITELGTHLEFEFGKEESTCI